MTGTDNKLIDQKITCECSQGGTNSSVVVDGEQQIPLANALGFEFKERKLHSKFVHDFMMKFHAYITY